MAYIVIHDPKLIIEIDDDADLEDSEENALDKIVSEDSDSLEYIGDTRVDDLTIKQTSYLYSAYKTFSDLAGLDIDKLLVYWLKSKNINFEVEYDIDIKEWQRGGYNIISLKEKEEK